VNLNDERGESSPGVPESPDGAVAPSKRLCRPKAIPDSVYPGMWRVQWPDGRVSDLANLTRINDAIACFVESAGRRKRALNMTQ
jgi:hypothetical protein